MAIQHAIMLLQEIETNQDFRKELYRCDHEDGLYALLKEHQLFFNFEEFEEAIRYLHVRCQTEDEASDLTEKSMWFKMLLKSYTEK